MPSTFTELVQEIRDVIYPYIQDKYNFFSVNKTNFDNIGNNLQSIINVDNNETNINSVQANEININALSSIKIELEALYANINSVINAKSNADEAKTFRDEAEGFKNDAALIAGGTILGENVQFSDSKSLEVVRSEIQSNIDNINTLLSSDDINLNELQEIVNYIKENRIEMDNQTATMGDMIWKQNLTINNLLIEGII